MSLIHQALKKVETESGAPSAQSASVSARTLGNSFKLRDDRLYKALVALAVLVIAVLAGWYYFSPVQHAPVVQSFAVEKPSSASVVQNVDLQSHKQKGIRMYETGRYEEALSEFKAAIAANPNDAVAFNNAGLASVALNNPAEAEEQLKTALRLAPDYPEALNNYGSLLVQRGRPAQAVELLKKAVSIKPDYADAQLNLAISYESAGFASDAIPQYEKFLQLGSNELLNADVRKKIVILKDEAASHRVLPSKAR
ncbi:MAG: tetratricopeptide repeat protein [Deltaproteobacteria bacterium]|nr:tetratricopeptide repeat protein [Deltaproteobacteria bacterium]